jgi:hypothetical protein
MHRTARILRPFVSTLTVIATVLMPYAAFVPIAGAIDTDWHVHGLDAFVNSGWSGGVNVRISDNLRTSANSKDDKVEYYDFGFGIPAGATIDGIEVEVEGYTTSTRQIEVSLSGDNGANYTASQTTSLAIGVASEGVDSLGGPADLWGGIWTPDTFADGNFRVKLDATSVGPGPIVYVDQLRVRVQYTPKRRSRGATLEYGTMVLEKYIRNEATASFDEFRYDVDGAMMGTSGWFDDSGRTTFENVPAGQYSVWEEAEGYTTTYGGDCDEQGSITVPANESVTCTVTNTADGWEEGDGEQGPSPTPTPEPEEGVGGSGPDYGTLIVEKVFLPEDAASDSFSDFSFSVGSGSYQFEEDGSNELSLEPGDYTVAEDLLSGYTNAYGGACDADGSVTVVPDQTATCIVYNTLGVGGFNPGSDIPAPTPTPTPKPQRPLGLAQTGQTSGTTGSDGAGSSPSPSASPSAGEGFTAAIGGFLAIDPCVPDLWPWVIVNAILFLVALWWLSRGEEGIQWRKVLVVLAVLAALLSWWRASCGGELRWLPVVLAAIVLLRLWLRGRKSS